MPKLRHHDGWYNGNPDHMIPNGTYADFRDIIVRRVENGFYDRTWGKDKGAEKLDEWDAQWNALPLEVRQTARSLVIKDSTPWPVVVDDEISGRKIKGLRARPSAGNNLEIGRFNTDKPKLGRPRKLPAEPLSLENSPLDLPAEESVVVDSVAKRGPGRPKKVESLSEDNSPLAPSA